MKKIALCLLLVAVTQVSGEERIISAGGSVTEILYALGLEEQIIAVDSSSIYPAAASEKPSIGYYRQMSAEGVLSLNPTLVVASNGAGPEEALKHIAGAGVKTQIFTQEIYTINAWSEYLQSVGEFFGAQDKANAIVKRVNAALKEIKPQHKDVIFLIGLGDRGPVAAGANTVPDMLFQLAGMQNLVTEFESYKPYSVEALIAAKPDLVVMPGHVVGRLGGRQIVCEQEVMQMLFAGRDCELLVMDPLLALGYGTRIDQAVQQLTEYE